MDNEKEYISISAIQHYSYCPRQCALIHVENIFDENLYTLRGHAVHERVDVPETRMEYGTRVERALPLVSHRLGLIGKADVVEFDSSGTPYPIEYKHGPNRTHTHDDLQLTAQAICLEEATGKKVSVGAIYHYSSRQRREVLITEELRQQVEMITEAIRAMLSQPRLPPAVNDKRCRNCSLIDACQPGLVKIDNQCLSKLHQNLFKPEDDPI